MNVSGRINSVSMSDDDDCYLNIREENTHYGFISAWTGGGKGSVIYLGVTRSFAELFVFMNDQSAQDYYEEYKNSYIRFERINS